MLTIEDPSERQAQARKLQAEGIFGADRMFVGRRGDGGVLVDMRDASGKTRLRLGVASDGTASIDFLDADGRVVKSLSGDS